MVAIGGSGLLAWLLRACVVRGAQRYETPSAGLEMLLVTHAVEGPGTDARARPVMDYLASVAGWPLAAEARRPAGGGRLPDGAAPVRQA